MTVYIVIGQCCTPNDQDTIIKVFSTYDKACEYLKRCVADEKQSKWFLNSDCDTYEHVNPIGEYAYWEAFCSQYEFVKYNIEKREVE